MHSPYMLYTSNTCLYPPPPPPPRPARSDLLCTQTRLAHTWREGFGLKWARISVAQRMHLHVLESEPDRGGQGYTNRAAQRDVLSGRLTPHSVHEQDSQCRTRVHVHSEPQYAQGSGDESR